MLQNSELTPQKFLLLLLQRITASNYTFYFIHTTLICNYVKPMSKKQYLRNNYPCFPIKRSMEGESALQERLYKSVHLLLIKTGGSVSVFKSQSYKTLVSGYR